MALKIDFDHQASTSSVLALNDALRETDPLASYPPRKLTHEFMQSPPRSQGPPRSLPPGRGNCPPLPILCSEKKLTPIPDPPDPNQNGQTRTRHTEESKKAASEGPTQENQTDPTQSPSKMAKANVNEPKKGVIPTTLKVYGWFDEGEQRQHGPGLTEQQLSALVTAGKVATNRDLLREPEILLEEMLKGPYFGDARSTTPTSKRLLKLFC